MTNQNYNQAKEIYSQIGVDTDKAIENEGYKHFYSLLAG